MPQGPIIVLDGPPGRAYTATGLVVMRDTQHRLFSDRKIKTDRDTLNTITLYHEWIHYLQSISCASVNYAGQQMIYFSEQAIKEAAQGQVQDETHKRIKELYKTIFTRRANKAVEILDRPGETIIIPNREGHQIKTLNIMEGVAVLESFKICAEKPTVDNFLRFRDKYLPGDGKDVYRITFNVLANKIGTEASFHMLGPISFLSLQTTDPPETFFKATNILTTIKNPDYTELSKIKVLAAMVFDRDWVSMLRAYEGGEPESGHTTLDPCTTFVVKQLGVERAMQISAAPSQSTFEEFKVFFPPVIAYSGQKSISYNVQEYATTTGLAEKIFNFTSIIGTAVRLTIDAENNVYQFCPHKVKCPHFESALCHEYFAPPGVERSHENCRFPGLIEQVSKHRPNELWKAVGREIISTSQLLKEFEDIGPAKIWWLIRRRRSTVVNWWGEAVYADLESQCQMTADQSMKALKSQNMNEVMKAQMFRGAVVKQIKKLAHNQ